MPKLTLRGWLVSAVALLVVLNFAWRIYAGWGLVTLNADKRPLREVVAAIERQAHVTLKTNLDPATPVTLRLEKVPVTEALELLAAVTDARWRLAYAVANNTAKARGAFVSWVAAAGNSTAPDGWKWFDHPLPFGGDLLGGNDNSGSVVSTPDPRREPWKTAEPASAPKTLHAYLDQGSNLLDVAFLVPADWNPAVTRTPAAGPLARVTSKLASAAGGSAEESFLLMKGRGRGGPLPSGPPPDGAQTNNGGGPPPSPFPGGGPRPDRGGPGGPPGMAAMAAQIQTRIDSLPPDQKAAAQAKFNAEREFWQSLRDLSPEERRAKMEARFSDPAMQDRMMERAAARDALLTPQQRVDRYRNYVQRREQIKNR